MSLIPDLHIFQRVWIVMGHTVNGFRNIGYCHESCHQKAECCRPYAAAYTKNKNLNKTGLTKHIITQKHQIGFNNPTIIRIAIIRTIGNKEF